MSDPDLLAVSRGSITAPAGCGKTHLIATALARHNGPKPILVLTHTNAGVAALRARLEKQNVSRNAYRLATIDGWAMRLSGTYLQRSGLSPEVLKLTTPRTDYPAIKSAMQKLLEEGHVDDIIKASYERLIVDEYQDCTAPQHAIIVLLSKFMPTCVLGDPLQAIFGWSGPIPDWQNEVQEVFPAIGELKTPWRWKNAGTEDFGRWLLSLRPALRAGAPIDLSTAPSEVSLVHLDGANDRETKIKAAATKLPVKNGSALLIAKSYPKDNHWFYATRVRGASVVENADLGEFVDLAREFNPEASNAVDWVIDLAGKVLTGVGAADMKKRVSSLRAGTNRKEANQVEQAALDFVKRPSFPGAGRLLEEIGQQAGVYPYRPSLLRACMQALNNCTNREEFVEVAMQVREQNRVLGRTIRGRAVGSTLLLKGLEADMSIMLETDSLSANDIYVAMTRGSKRLIVCSKSDILDPS